LKTPIFFFLAVLGGTALNLTYAQPQTSYNVHREYDKQGTLIQYDSSVVTSWHTDTLWADNDSLITSWQISPDSTRPSTAENHLAGMNTLFPDGFEIQIPSLNGYFPQEEIDHILEEFTEVMIRFDVDNHLNQMEQIFQKLQSDMEQEFVRPGIHPSADSTQVTPSDPRDPQEFQDNFLEL